MVFCYSSRADEGMVLMKSHRDWRGSVYGPHRRCVRAGGEQQGLAGTAEAPCVGGAGSGGPVPFVTSRGWHGVPGVILGDKEPTLVSQHLYS